MVFHYSLGWFNARRVKGHTIYFISFVLGLLQHLKVTIYCQVFNDVLIMFYGILLYYGFCILILFYGILLWQKSWIWRVQVSINIWVRAVVIQFRVLMMLNNFVLSWYLSLYKWFNFTIVTFIVKICVLLYLNLAWLLPFQEALDVVHISKEDQQTVFAMLTAVLWLGNISFNVIDNENHVEALEDESKYLWEAK